MQKYTLGIALFAMFVLLDACSTKEGEGRKPEIVPTANFDDNLNQMEKLMNHGYDNVWTLDDTPMSTSTAPTWKRELFTYNIETPNDTTLVAFGTTVTSNINNKPFMGYSYGTLEKINDAAIPEVDTAYQSKVYITNATTGATAAAIAEVSDAAAKADYQIYRYTAENGQGYGGEIKESIGTTHFLYMKKTESTTIVELIIFLANVEAQSSTDNKKAFIIRSYTSPGTLPAPTTAETMKAAGIVPKDRTH